MAGGAKQQRLFGELRAPEGVVHLNDRCLIRTRAEHRVVVVSGIVLAQYGLGERMAEAHAMVSLVEQGWADQNDVAIAFGCSARTVRRHQRRYEAGGLSALGHRDGYPHGRRRLQLAHARWLTRLKDQGLSIREIAQRMGVSEKAVRKALRRLGWLSEETQPARLPAAVRRADPNLSAFSNPPCPSSPLEEGVDERAPLSLDTDPADRRLDRLLAYLGLLDDAAPLFRSGNRLPYAGVLLAIPPLVGSGVLDIAREVYGSIGPAFYGLRTTILALLLLALLRIKRPEALKEHRPADLGRLLGLDRAPEVKTLRRKLTRLAAFRRASPFGRALAERRVAARGAALGFLYVDGHVRVYHAKRAEIPFCAIRLRSLALPRSVLQPSHARILKG